MPTIKILPNAVHCPSGMTVNAEEGQKLVEVLEENGITLQNKCQHRGVCGSCIVDIIEGYGHLNEPEDEELDQLEFNTKAKDTSRLACQTKILGNCTIEIP